MEGIYFGGGAGMEKRCCRKRELYEQRKGNMKGCNLFYFPVWRKNRGGGIVKMHFYSNVFFSGVFMKILSSQHLTESLTQRQILAFRQDALQEIFHTPDFTETW